MYLPIVETTTFVSATHAFVLLTRTQTQKQTESQNHPQFHSQNITQANEKVNDLDQSNGQESYKCWHGLQSMINLLISQNWHLDWHPENLLFDH